MFTHYRLKKMYEINTLPYRSIPRYRILVRGLRKSFLACEKQMYVFLA